MRILVAGMVARCPGQGGATWAVLQWVLGLRALGHDVQLVEQLPAPATAAQVAYAREVGEPVRLFSGPAPADLRAQVGRVDLLVNLSGVLRDPALREAATHRLYVDLDPAFTQIWHEQGADVGLDGHTAYATVGLAVGGCAVPTVGRDWIATPPPIVLTAWRPGAEVLRHAATSVGHWRSYGPVERHGVRYGQRAHAVRPLLGLAARSPLPLQLALGIAPEETADLQALRAAGWQLLDPLEVAGTPRAYRDFVRSSLAELGTAKSGYVVSGSGWFSDRSAAYLAAGRPVVAQDTGWSAYLPTGAGLHAFDGVEDAAAALERVAADYRRESAAAHEVARTHLDAGIVLPRLLAQVTG